MGNEKASLVISTENLLESRRLILFLIVSAITALKEEAITLRDIEKLLFSPYTARRLEEAGFEEEIINMIYLGCELDDVRLLMPDALEKSMNQIYDLALDKLKDLDFVAKKNKKWID